MPATQGQFYTQRWDAIREEFVNNHRDHNLLTFRQHFSIRTSLLAECMFLQEEIKKLVPDCAVRLIGTDNGEIQLVGANPPLLVFVLGSNGSPSYVEQKQTVTISVLADPELGQRLMEIVEARHTETLPIVHWWYRSGNDLKSEHIVLEPFNSTIYPEFYPWLDVPNMMTDFMNSSASILILTGPPGTGKTSIIRNFLYSNNLSAYISYEQNVLSSDTLFVNFLTSKVEVMLLEDSDLLLTARETGNDGISRFLNVSDGVIRFPRKKIIFTTNLPNLKDVDSALIRRGRCYGVVSFRELTFEEAVIAARAAKLPVPTEQRNYTMAELFNQHTGNDEDIKRKRVGFVR